VLAASNRGRRRRVSPHHDGTRFVKDPCRAACPSGVGGGRPATRKGKIEDERPHIVDQQRFRRFSSRLLCSLAVPSLSISADNETVQRNCWKRCVDRSGFPKGLIESVGQITSR